MRKNTDQNRPTLESFIRYAQKKRKKGKKTALLTQNCMN